MFIGALRYLWPSQYSVIRWIEFYAVYGVSSMENDNRKTVPRPPVPSLFFNPYRPTRICHV